MREISSRLPFSWIKDLVNSKAGWRGDGQFLDLLIPALKTLEDEDILDILSQRVYACYIWATLPGQIARNLDANDIALFREYVVRRLRTIKEEEAELKARESLRKIKEELFKDPSYTGIKSVPEKWDYFNVIQNELLGGPAIGTYPNSASNQAGNITLEKLKLMLENLKKKGI